MDIEKAFHFLNRTCLINDLKNAGVGCKLLNATLKMYTETNYSAKLSNNSIGEQ